MQEKTLYLTYSIISTVFTVSYNFRFIIIKTRLIYICVFEGNFYISHNISQKSY